MLPARAAVMGSRHVPIVQSVLYGKGPHSEKQNT